MGWNVLCSDHSTAISFLLQVTQVLVQCDLQQILVATCPISFEGADLLYMLSPATPTFSELLLLPCFMLGLKGCLYSSEWRSDFFTQPHSRCCGLSMAPKYSRIVTFLDTLSCTVFLCSLVAAMSMIFFFFFYWFVVGILYRLQQLLLLFWWSSCQHSVSSKLEISATDVDTCQGQLPCTRNNFLLR